MSARDRGASQAPKPLPVDAPTSPTGDTPSASVEAVKDVVPKEALPAAIQSDAASRDPQVESQAAAGVMAAQGVADKLGLAQADAEATLSLDGAPTHEIAALARHSATDAKLVDKGAPSATALAEANNPTLDTQIPAPRSPVAGGKVRVRVVGPGSLVLPNGSFAAAGTIVDLSPEDVDHHGALVERV